MTVSEKSIARGEEERFLVSAAHTSRYAQAICDANRLYREGRIAPPGFAVVPIVEPVVAARQTVTTAPGLHGEHDLKIFRPIRPGMILSTQARVAGVWPTSAGLTVIVHTTSRSGDGTTINEQYFSVLVPGEMRTEGCGERFPKHRMPDGLTRSKPAAERSFDLDLGLGRRYAEASGDMSPYTFDESAARGRGLPGVIVGGICTLSYAARAAIEALGADDPESLKRLALRFSSLLLLCAGQRLTFRFWNDPSSDHGVFRFEAYDKDHNPVATHGFVRIGA